MNEDDENSTDEQTDDLAEVQKLIEQDKILDSENQKRVGGNTSSYKDLKFPVPKYPEM
jgi:hypothetical protein